MNVKHFVQILAIALLAPATLSLAAPSESVTLTSPLDSVHASTTESTLGDLTADSILASVGNADFALVPADETKPDTIPSGSVSSTQLVAKLRSSNEPSDTVAYAHLTGQEVIDALNHGASRSPSPYDGFLQVAGIHVTFHHDSNGQLVVESVTLSSTHSALDTGATYTVAMPKYMADGALGYFAVWPSDFSIKDTGVSVSDAVTKYATSHSPLAYQVEGRITGA